MDAATTLQITSPQFWVAAFEIILVNIVLSGDNAVVIALACRNLPLRQRKWGIFWGAAGAIVLRIILTIFALSLLQLPWLKIVGGVLLFWIGIKLIAEEDGGDGDVKASNRLLAAVKTVIVADLVMSLDNVIGVAAAAKGSVVLLVFGLVVSIPIVIVGSQVIMKLIEKLPILVIAGGGLLGFIAGEMIVEDAVIVAWVKANAGWLLWAAPVACTALVVAAGMWLKRHGAKAEAP